MDDLGKRLRKVKDWWREPGRTAEQAADRIEQLEKALTPSIDTKVAYHGEFSFLITVRVEDEETGEPINVERNVMVP